MPAARIIALSIGRPRLVSHAGRTFNTAINRKPVDHPLALTPDGLAGDRVADQRHHGGPEQVLCVYPHENYQPVAEFLGSGPLAIPSFGENLTTTGLTEHATAIGDTFRIGTALVQVSKPREPCATLARKHDNRDLLSWIIRHRRCGFYLRVLEPGDIAPDAAIDLADRPTPDLSVADALGAMMDRNAPPELLAAAANCPTLSPDWRAKLHKRLAVA